MHVRDILSKGGYIRNTSEHHGACEGTRGGGGNSLIKVGTDMWARALGILGINFCPGSRFWEVNFARALGFWQFLTKNV